MKLSKFKFELPEELLAEHPAEERDESRLMVVHRDTGEIEHKLFKDLINYFDDGDLLIMNDTKVFPARMYGNKEKTGARIEVFLLRELNRESLEPIVQDLIKSNETNFKGVGQPLRIALTGSKFGPGIYDIIISLGKDDVEKRLTNKVFS